MDGLKPCPFCDGEAEVERVGTSGSSHAYAAVCEDCGARAERTPDKQGATTAWNRRAKEKTRPNCSSDESASK